MDLIYLVVFLAAVGFVVWLVTTQLDMPPQWAKVIQVVALVAVVLYLITRFLPIPNILHR